MTPQSHQARLLTPGSARSPFRDDGVGTPARDRSRSTYGIDSIGGDVAEFPPRAGQTPNDWLLQELGRGRRMMKQGGSGRGRIPGRGLITQRRLADLFLGGSLHRARDWYRATFDTDARV